MKTPEIPFFLEGKSKIAIASDTPAKKSNLVVEMTNVYCDVGIISKRGDLVMKEDVLAVADAIIGKPIGINHDFSMNIGASVSPLQELDGQIVNKGQLWKHRYQYEIEEIENRFNNGEDIPTSFEMAFGSATCTECGADVGQSYYELYQHIGKQHSDKKVPEVGRRLHDLEPAGTSILLSEAPGFENSKILALASAMKGENEMSIDPKEFADLQSKFAVLQQSMDTMKIDVEEKGKILKSTQSELAIASTSLLEKSKEAEQAKADLQKKTEEAEQAKAELQKKADEEEARKAEEASLAQAQAFMKKFSEETGLTFTEERSAYYTEKFKGIDEPGFNSYVGEIKEMLTAKETPAEPPITPAKDEKPVEAHASARVFVTPVTNLGKSSIGGVPIGIMPSLYKEIKGIK